MTDLDTSLLVPVLALAAWSLLILLVLIGRRAKHASAARISPQQMRNPDLAYEVCTESINNMANNFKHLFEVPVLFYVICVISTLIGATGFEMAALAWLFVVFRIVHSLIQCTANIVMLRLSVFALSVLVLLAMMGLVVVELI